MAELNLNEIYGKLRGGAPYELLQAVFDLRRALEEVPRERYPEAASALGALFYIDTTDRPDLAPVVNNAIRTLASMGPELIPHLLEEMRGADFQAQQRYAQVLASFGAAAVEPILQRFQEAGDPGLLLGGIFALSKISDPSLIKALPMIIGYCSHSEAELRGVAVRAVGKFAEHLPPDSLSAGRRKAMFEVFQQATLDPQPPIRAKAVRGLGKMAHHGLLDKDQAAQATARIEQILGRHATYDWDAAFVVRREAEEALEYFRV